MASPRLLKLAEQIKNITAQMLERRIKDPRLGFVTLTDVRLTGDSRDATIFYTVMGDDAARADTQAALQSATGVIRSQIGKQLGLRFTPTLTFILDAVPENAQHIEELLAQARQGDAEVADRAAQANYAGEADPYKKKAEEDLDQDG
ncbi:MAG TPA: 30S ribosome-binding factor RbfA [Candidatus Avipropionibacterium avicola]|uniref:Ribosome-binding factor A n=1 Tax=Candidatus Avipropionibacterium avicola TaxID=2840701 RepID=A0A9D1KP57_9ACTN|nr:30S ribosome-binding factor RbfA [Candidatus Avipropionibacterium avicola]